MRVALVALAGAAGAAARYGVGVHVGVRDLPYATFGINVVGACLLGLLLGAAAERGWPDAVVVPLAVGFLGAFTTFSTFSYELLALLRDDRAVAAAGYAAASVVGGVLAATVGWVAARTLA